MFSSFCAERENRERGGEFPVRVFKYSYISSSQKRFALLAAAENY
jgi:hypothetical protein